MKIAVLSGKGGTGKTTVAASLATVLPDSQYADCDVEEPNGFIFLRPDLLDPIDVQVLVPQVDPDACTGCGACGRICQFNAIAVVKKNVLIFPELCHHCGACILVCEPGALCEVKRTIGTIECDKSGSFIQGRLIIGEPAGIPIIEAIKQSLDPQRTAILDCSPGAACTVVKSLEGIDFALLVTEPTPFGLHDLRIAVRLVQKMEISAGVVINKAGSDNHIITDFCRQYQLPVLLEIPFSRTIAEHYADGRLPIDGDPIWQARFLELAEKIHSLVKTAPLSGDDNHDGEVRP
ncbi:MAG: ATP-binding protein [Bacillota bacterium]|nr:ATP-binding protein [Bacillota bacterium]